MKQCTGMTAIAAVAALACAGSAFAGPRVTGVTGINGAKSGSKLTIATHLVGDADVQGDGGTSGVSGFLWYNGAEDYRVAILSTVNPHVDARAADDCWFKEGIFYDIDCIYVRMLVTNGFTPDTDLFVYADCDGRPDDSLGAAVYPQDSFTVVDAAPAGFAGHTLYEIKYDLHNIDKATNTFLDTFGQGEEIAWLSPVHKGLGLAFWMSANNGTIQGRQAQYKAPAFGFPTWDDAEKELCCGICTDYYLRVEGKCCWRILNQSNYDLAGLSSPILSQNVPWARSLDDVQVADPCDGLEEYGICRIEAYFATNCDLSTVYGEIYDNECDTALDPETYRNRLTPDWCEPLGVTFSGLPVYKFVFRCPPDTLDTGKNYWFSIFSEQGGFAGKRSIWLFNQRSTCSIRLNEAQYYNPSIGFATATPVSNAALNGAARDHAWSFWVCKPDTE